ncbi:MAG: hypothetical protein ACKOHM_05545 [Spartobacteria bacterium]
MKTGAEFSENEIPFDDDNEACEEVDQPVIDTDGDHLAETAKLFPEQATGSKARSLEGRKTQNTPRDLTWRREQRRQAAAEG